MEKLPNWNTDDVKRILKANGWHPIGNYGKDKIKYTNDLGEYIEFSDKHENIKKIKSIFKKFKIIPDAKLAKKIKRKVNVNKAILE